MPAAYYEYLNVWDAKKASKILPSRSIDHTIKLKDGAYLFTKKVFGISRKQATVVKKYINNIFKKGYIKPSILLYTAPVLIVKKLDRNLRVYVDYRALNSLIIKNRNILPLIREILSRLYKAKIYFKFNIIAVFNKIRIKEKHKIKTAFLTRYGLYEYIVMPFGLYNTPGTF